MSITFCTWLKKQKRRDDPIGDLARDSMQDKGTPRGNASFYTWQKYLLQFVRYDSPAMKAFYQAWQEYELDCHTMRLLTASEILQTAYNEDRLNGYWVEGIDQNENIFTRSIDAESVKDAKEQFLAFCKKYMPKARITVTYIELIGTDSIITYKNLLKGHSKSNGEITLRKRFRVMRRDGYQCQLCGKSAQDGAVLEVDHKRPRSKGGTDEMDNLWTLCFECNRGKSNLSL